jgi:hypothetical protein
LERKKEIPGKGGKKLLGATKTKGKYNLLVREFGIDECPKRV